MLKIGTTLLVLIALLSISFSQPVMGQSVVASREPDVVSDQNAPSRPDLRKAIALNEQKYRDMRASDVKALEKISRQTPTKTGWSRRKKTYAALIVFGVAAIVFVAIKYGKTCKRSSPAGCTTGSDENCTCEEYEQNL